MLEGRTRRWAVVAALLVVACGCAGAGASRPGAQVSDVRTIDTNGTHTLATHTTPAPAPDPVAPVEARAPTPAPEVEQAVTVGHMSPARVAAAAPSVTIGALVAGGVTINDVRACSDISAQSITDGQLVVHRTGPTDAALAVPYSVAGVAADHKPLAGVVTIPAGADRATILVQPSFTETPAPLHVHRSSGLTLTLGDGAGYDLGAPSSATIPLRFSVDLYGCEPVVTVP